MIFAGRGESSALESGKLFSLKWNLEVGANGWHWDCDIASLSQERDRRRFAWDKRENLATTFDAFKAIIFVVAR